jgi:hypothetical protein
MNVVKIYKIIRAVLAVSKIAMPVLEDLFQKDLNKDGVIGQKKAD